MRSKFVFINIYARVFCMKFWRQSQNVIRKAAEKDVCTKKAREKMLMKLIPKFVFITLFCVHLFFRRRKKGYRLFVSHSIFAGTEY